MLNATKGLTTPLISGFGHCFGPIGVVDVEHNKDGNETPDRNRKLVGVEEVVQQSMDEIAEQGKRYREGDNSDAFLFGPFVNFKSGIHDQYHQQHHDEHAKQAHFGQWPDKLTVRISFVAGVGADDGFFFRTL